VVIEIGSSALVLFGGLSFIVNRPFTILRVYH
jgi:hypothetical protein